jgi:uncharacterized membrane protein
MLSLFPLHPRFVHFPIALLLMGSLVAVVYIARQRAALSTLAWGMILLGWIMLFPAILTGLIDQDRAVMPPAAVQVMDRHIAAGFGLIIVYGLALYERLRAPAILDHPRRRLLVLLWLGLGVALLVAAGALGGQLVYTYGVGSRS